MRKEGHPLFLAPRVCVAGAALALISYAAAGFAAGKPHPKPPADRDAEEFDRPGEWADWMHSQRAFPQTALPDSVYLVGWEEWRAVTQQAPASGGVEPFARHAPPQWQLIGPVGLTYAGSGTPNMGPAAGRTTAFVIDPTNANTMYAGFALGGVWKSTDGGASWTSTTDGQPSLAIGALVLDATNPMIVYAGTGEGNYSGDSFYGQGILKSTNTDVVVNYLPVGSETATKSSPRSPG